MSYRRRHRWFRRLALGLAFASVLVAGRASVAAATVDGGAVIPYLSHGLLTEADAQAAAAEAIHDSVRPDHFATSQQPQQTPYMSLGLQAEFQAARPDDLADRFAHSDVAGRPEPTTAEGWRVEWDDAIVLTIGTFVLSLGLGLALSHFRRPRLAGL